MKLCKDCKHIKNDHLCAHPLNMRVDLVSGDMAPGESGLVGCAAIRSMAVFCGARLCGPDANWFEQKPEPQPKKPWWAFWK